MQFITRMAQDGMKLGSPDFREFGTFGHRPLPIPLTMVNHAYEPEVIGRIDEIVKDAEGVSWGRGETASTFEGTKAATLIRERMLPTVSVTPGGYDVIELFVDPDSGDEIVIDGADWDELDSWLEAHPDANYVPRFDNYLIGELSLVTIPGWTEAAIWATDAEGAPAWPVKDLQASAAAPAVREFPPEWFDRTEFAGPTPLSIDRDGRISGHVCLWDTCHRAFTELGQCVTPPREADLNDFHGGVSALTDGRLIRTGVLTFADLHTSMGQPTREEIMRAIEDTGTQLGPVRAFKDEYGIQVAGGLHGDVSPDQAGRAMAGTPSGDWRDGALFGVHVVNTGGFPILESDMPHDPNRVVLASSLPPALPVGCGCGEPEGEACSCGDAQAAAWQQVNDARVRLSMLRAARLGLVPEAVADPMARVNMRAKVLIGR